MHLPPQKESDLWLNATLFHLFSVSCEHPGLWSLMVSATFKKSLLAPSLK